MPIFKIIASNIGNDAGPFTIKNNLGQVVATGVTRLQLLNGYSFNVATGITSVTATSTGNCTNEVTMNIPNEGYWEMEKNNIENVNDHYGATQDNYVAPVESFVSEDVVGVYTGVVSGTGTWLIKAGPEDIAGTVYNGGGTLIATGANTNTATLVESGAILQLGFDLDALRGSVGGTLTVQSGGVVNVLGADDGTGRTAFAAIANSGEINITGPEVCGEGNFRNAGAFTNNGLITIDDAKFTFNNPTTITGTGIIRVEDGGTLFNGNIAMPATQTLKLNGCGKCNATGNQEGALLYNSAVTIASPIEIESDTCMKSGGTGATVFSGVISGSSKLTLDNSADTFNKQGSARFSNANNTFTGDVVLRSTSLIDNHPLAFQYSNMIMEREGAIQSNQAMTFKSLSSDSPTTSIISWNVPITLTDNGITTFAGTIHTSSTGFNAVTLDGVGNELTLTNPTTRRGGYRVLNGAKVAFTGGQIIGQLAAENGSKFTFGKTTTGGINDGTLTMTGNSVIEVQAISPTQAGTFTAFGAFNVTGGYTVDLVDPLVAGTYNIMRAAAGGTGVGQIPTIGVNNTGLTPTFAWSGQFLTVNLA